MIKCIESSSYSSSFFIENVYAKELGAESSPISSSDNDLIYLLQNERTDVGVKITALDTLIDLNSKEVEEYIVTVTSKEPMVLTLMDLGRHSDKELAYKAKSVIGKFDVDGYISEKLVSVDERDRKIAELILLRMDKLKAESIIQNVLNNVDNSWIRNLQEKIENNLSKLLIPTGSADGDRYYVEALWDSENKQVVDCLTNFFYKSLNRSQNIEDEKIIMKDRTKRIVYSSSKDTILWVVEQIEKCGGTASFVGL